MRYDNLEPKTIVRNVIDKAGAATLTPEECMFTLIRQSANNAITLPAASGHLKGCDVIVSAAHASGCTVTVAAGFHGTGSSHDTVTLAQGDAGHFYCDGSYWYNSSGIASA